MKLFIANAGIAWKERKAPQRPNFLTAVGLGTILPIFIILIWGTIANLNLVSSLFLPTPSAVAQSFLDLFVTGQLWTHLGISLSRALYGFILGGGIGIIVGLLVGFSRHAEELLDPSMQMFRVIPNLALAPVLILWLGFGEFSKVAIIATGSFFPLYVYTFKGIRSVDQKLFDVSNVLSFSRYKRLTRLILPSALPSILLGIRLSLAISWLSLVVAELIGSEAGVGFLITLAQQSSNTATIFVAVIIFAVVGIIVDSSVRFLERRLLKWRDSYQG